MTKAWLDRGALSFLSYLIILTSHSASALFLLSHRIGILEGTGAWMIAPSTAERRSDLSFLASHRHARLFRRIGDCPIDGRTPERSFFFSRRLGTLVCSGASVITQSMAERRRRGAAFSPGWSEAESWVGMHFEARVPSGTTGLSACPGCQQQVPPLRVRPPQNRGGKATRTLRPG